MRADRFCFQLPLLWLAIATLLSMPASALADSPSRDLAVLAPLPYQVVQREGFVPTEAHEDRAGGPELGHAAVRVRARFPRRDQERFEFRIVRLPDAFGRDVDWTPLAVSREGEEITGTADAPAGGWYRLEVRSLEGDRSVATAAVEPFGVGELFVVAGQSYAAGANDELLKIEDPRGRVAAYDLQKGSWQVANDPQPGRGDGGTIWPPLGDLLLPVARVPIGFVNVAVGGTSSRQWHPGGPLHNDLVAAGKAAGRFRAVLWQQGESDVIEKTSTERYVEAMQGIRGELNKQLNFEPPWLLAKSTFHPTVYLDPEGEGRIREAIDRLCQMPGFHPGPDTDILGGENRGGPNTRRHFSGTGQRRAALLWFAAIWQELNREP